MNLLVLVNSCEVSQLQMILAMSCWIYGFTQCYIVFEVVISSQNIIKEHEMLLECICEKKTHGWLVHEDPYLDRIIRFLNKFDGFNANDYFVLNKPLLIGMLANFVTYFIILVQFSYIWTPQSIKKHKRHLTIFCDFDHLDVFERGNVTINFSFFSPFS